MQFQQFVAARADTGAVLPHGRVTVFVANTATLATIFDGNGAALGNPANADANGLAGIAAPNGSYDILVSSADGAYSAPLVESVQFYDLGGLDAQVALAGQRATSASLSAATALAATNMYPTTAAGLAAVAEGKYFAVAGDGTSTYAILYRKTGGVAVQQAAYASKAAYEGPTGGSLIGFQQPEAGSVLFDVASKAGLILSIYDFIPRSEWAAVRAGTANDDAQPWITRALAAAMARGSSYVDLHGAQLRLLSGFQPDIGKVGIRGDGAYLDFSGMTTGDAIRPINSAADPNFRTGNNLTRRLHGFTINGPGAMSGVRGVVIDDAAAVAAGQNPFIPNVFLEAMLLRNFATELYIGNGAVFTTAMACEFTASGPSVAPTTPMIDVPAAANAGERNSFWGCVLANRRFFFRQANGNADTHFFGCSQDYSPDLMGEVRGGTVWVHGGHIEGNSDVDHWWKVLETNASLNVLGTQVFIGAVKDAQGNVVPKTQYSPFYSDAAAVMGGVSLSNVEVNIASAATVPIVGGTGRLRHHNVMQLRQSQYLPIGAGANLLAYADMESSNTLTEYTIAGNVTLSSDQKHTGSQSMKLVGANPLNATAFARFPASPGQTVTGECYVMTTGVAAGGGTMTVTVSWLDAGGNTLAPYEPLHSMTDLPGWTRFPLLTIEPAPPGARQLQVYFGMLGSGTAYVDSVLVTAS